MMRCVKLCTGVAARAAVRSVERFARRLALGSVTGGITLSDILLYMTMTKEGLSPVPVPVPVTMPVPAPAPGPVLPPPLEENLVVTVLGGMVVFVGAVIVGCHIADKVKQRSYWPRFHGYEKHTAKRTLAGGGMAPGVGGGNDEATSERDY